MSHSRWSDREPPEWFVTLAMISQVVLSCVLGYDVLEDVKQVVVDSDGTLH